MGRKIVLPFTCETQSKLGYITSLFLLVTGVLSMILFFTNGVPPPNGIGALWFIYMLLATACGVSFLLMKLSLDDKWPEFQCKTKSEAGSS